MGNIVPYLFFLSFAVSFTELFDDDIVSLVEICFSHQLMQYLALLFVGDCLSDDAASDLLKEIIYKHLSSIKLGSGSTKLNVFLGDEWTNLVRGADLLELNLLQENELVKALLEIDGCLIGWRCVLGDDLFSLFNVLRLSQISDKTILRVKKDSCFLLYALLGRTVLFK